MLSNAPFQGIDNVIGFEISEGYEIMLVNEYKVGKARICTDGSKGRTSFKEKNAICSWPCRSLWQCFKNYSLLTSDL